MEVLVGSLVFRSGGPADAEGIAALHADNWRRHYRGAFSDSFLDGDLDTERRAVWSERLAAPAGTVTIIAEDGDRLAAFVHVMLDHDPVWGSLVDNLHVQHGRHRTGIGSKILARAAEAVTEQAIGDAIYLWVLQQNTAGQHFYRAVGATEGETAAVPPPGGDHTRLNGSPKCLRMTWRDASQLSRAVDAAPPTD
ncbi:GNAT family N-acetyltransferase [Kribbella sp. CA-293567]|uniref:GNAT family N-acetyltransferase n=1 Tax=Kribbella sp. CA-293567 TaxID=3002436 RepID=UPI0022DE967F|nr:GNAT family N-acetyltransferase [Kribbella sp. CA-293567]WBQ02569.1 GNAT family N-acetyltransferase [Kribbella sp. CA-293567]